VKLIFVEDDPFILMCTTEALVSQGFEVVTASRGEEALALLSDTAGCLLMMLDVRLAGRIDGWEVARCARAAHPNIAIVYTTTADRFAFERESVDRSVLLQKPYTLNRAVSAAREACQMVDEGA
jgi:DNA-binding response OmpR family regulator